MMGFGRGSDTACVVWHREKNIVVSVHGSDVTAAGTKSALDWFEASMKEE